MVREQEREHGCWMLMKSVDAILLDVLTGVFDGRYSTAGRPDGLSWCRQRWLGFRPEEKEGWVELVLETLTQEGVLEGCQHYLSPQIEMCHFRFTCSTWLQLGAMGDISRTRGSEGVELVLEASFEVLRSGGKLPLQPRQTGGGEMGK